MTAIEKWYCTLHCCFGPFKDTFCLRKQLRPSAEETRLGFLGAGEKGSFSFSMAQSNGLGTHYDLGTIQVNRLELPQIISDSPVMGLDWCSFDQLFEDVAPTGQYIIE